MLLIVTSGRPSDHTGAEHPGEVPAPAAFLAALHGLRGARVRPEVTVEEVRAPARVAPFAVAIAGTIERPGFGGVLPDAGVRPGAAAPEVTGRFVLLHDPEGQETWQGDFRVVVMVRADLDPSLGSDPFLARVAWDWLDEALSGSGARHTLRAGTVTRVASESFGEIDGRPSTLEVEVRASWTPEDASSGSHLEAWSQLMCAVAGLEPRPAGVAVLRRAAAER
jgi:hypothetical protein